MVGMATSNVYLYICQFLFLSKKEFKSETSQKLSKGNKLEQIILTLPLKS